MTAQTATKDTTKTPTSSTEIYRRERSNSPKNIRENYMEKGTPETRRWVWASQAKMEVRVFRVGESRREGTKEGGAVCGPESDTAGTKAFVEGKPVMNGLGLPGSIFKDLGLSFHHWVW